MTLLEHLGELRAVLLQSLGVWALASAGAWMISERLVERLLAPGSLQGKPLVFFGPADAFVLRMKVALGAGLFAAAPVIAWRLWSFVVPGLLGRERSALLPIAAGSLVLFYSGALFAYAVILPISLRFLLGFGTESLQPMISGEKYFDFFLRVTLSFGAVFQFPLVTTLLAAWGLMPPAYLERHWRAGVVAVFAVAAILTPPDVVSQMMMAGPLLVLYGVAIVLARGVARGRGAGAASVGAAMTAGALAAALACPAPARALSSAARPALPDLAVRRDGLAREGSRVTFVVENLGDQPAPASVVELWDRPPLAGPTGTSSPYPVTRGESAVHVLQEPAASAPEGGPKREGGKKRESGDALEPDAVALTIVVSAGPGDERSRGALKLRRGESMRLARAVDGARDEADGRGVSWDAPIPEAGLAIPVLVPAHRGAPPIAELTLVAPPGARRVARIRSGTFEQNGFYARIELDCLERIAARRVRAACPALAPGARATLHAEFPGGEDAAGEFFAWVDPDDRILEAREGNNVSSMRGDAASWTQAALHIHSSFSEGAGSVDWQASMASRSGYDLVWWSEHDWRIACLDHVTRVGFEEGEPVELARGAGARSGAEITAQGADEGSRALRLAVDGAGKGGAAPAANGAPAGSRAYAALDAERKRLTVTLASGVTLSARVRAKGLGSDGRVRVVAELSHHPTERRRLVVERGARDLPEDDWTTWNIALTEEALSRWVNGDDDNLIELGFELEGAPGAEVLIDDVRVEHGECGAALRRIQESWMRFYPNLAHAFADEVSFGKPHLNQYGGTRGLFDTIRGWETPYVETVVRRVHAAGGIVSYCHPFGVRTGADVRERFGAAQRESILDSRFGGSDLLEVGFRYKASEDIGGYLRFWDEAGARGVAVTGIGVNDSHEDEWGAWENNFATWILGSAADEAALRAGLAGGRAFFGDPLRFRGRITLEADGRRAGDAAPAGGSRRVTVHVTQAPPRSRLVLVVDGEPVREWPGVRGERRETHELGRGEGLVVRAELWDEKGNPLAFTNPIYASARRGE